MSGVPVRLDQTHCDEAEFYHASARIEIHSGGVFPISVRGCRVQASGSAGSRQVKDANVSFVRAGAPITTGTTFIFVREPY